MADPAQTPLRMTAREFVTALALMAIVNVKPIEGKFRWVASRDKDGKPIRVKGPRTDPGNMPKVLSTPRMWLDSLVTMPTRRQKSRRPNRCCMTAREFVSKADDEMQCG